MGQVALDIFEYDDYYILKAPVAGVRRPRATTLIRELRRPVEVAHEVVFVDAQAAAAPGDVVAHGDRHHALIEVLRPLETVHDLAHD